jgi:diguanylate cyclase (GGDEF)-like protein/PAS domain S-box-containing protein
VVSVTFRQFKKSEGGIRIVSYVEDFPLSWNHLLEVLPDGIAFVDEHGTIRLANERLTILTGYTRDELVGQAVEVLVPLRGRDLHVAHRDEYSRDPKAREMGSGLDITLLLHDGNELAVEVALSPLAIDGKKWVVAMIRDDRPRRTAERVRTELELHTLAAAEALSESEQRFRLAFENNVAGMVFTDLEDKILAVNDAFCQMVGRTREELLGHDSTPFTYPEDLGITEEAHRRVTSGETDQVSYAKRYVHKDGRVMVVEVHRSTARDIEGKTLYFVMSERDITEERALTAQLSHQALHDPLTGLANRVLFEDRLSQAHDKTVRQGGLNAVLLVDLDDFKGVNDTLGHFVGDKLLVAIARRFDQVTRSSDTLCRFGGDEFLYLAEGLTSPTQAEQVAKRLLGALDEPFSIDGAHLAQHASIGVVVCDATSTDYTESIRDADVAMYEAKREGKGHHVLFAPGMRQQATSRFALLQELRHALQAGEISMHYQPIVGLAATEVVGFEALMRWQHPERGWVPPNVFIPLAEQSELILELGAFALREAVNVASSWERTGSQTSQPYVTVNLSAHQFHDPGLVSMIEGVLQTSGLIPERLIIEITESVTLLDVAETLGVIEHLNRLGIAIALDDFGTGYTSLSYLALLHPRIIKIDRSFVSPLHESARNDTLLETIVSLGHKLDMTMLAEGIETHAQLERLRLLRCEFGQGYLFSPAVPADEVEALLARVPANWG